MDGRDYARELEEALYAALRRFSGLQLTVEEGARVLQVLEHVRVGIIARTIDDLVKRSPEAPCPRVLEQLPAEEQERVRKAMESL